MTKYIIGQYSKDKPFKNFPGNLGCTGKTYETSDAAQDAILALLMQDTFNADTVFRNWGCMPGYERLEYIEIE